MIEDFDWMSEFQKLILAADEIERLAQVLELVYWDREKVLRDK